MDKTRRGREEVEEERSNKDREGEEGLRLRLKRSDEE